MHTLSKYSVCIRLIRRHRQDNTGYAVRLTSAYTELIFNICPANSRSRPIQYWIAFQADQCMHQVNIRYLSANPTASPRQYWMVRQLTNVYADWICSWFATTQHLPYPLVDMLFRWIEYCGYFWSDMQLRKSIRPIRFNRVVNILCRTVR